MLGLSHDNLVTLSYIAIAIAVFGIIGNFFNLLVFVRKRMRSPSTIILLGLTVFDLFIILTSTTAYSINVKYFYGYLVGHTTPLWRTRFVRYFLYPFTKTMYSASIYSIVLVTIERYLAVYWPWHGRQTMTNRKAGHGVLAVILFSVLLNAPRWFEHVTVSDGDRRINLGEHPLYLFGYEGLVWLIMMYILPLVIIIVLSILIWKQIRWIRSLGDKPTSSQEAEKKLTRMLMTVVVVAIILNLINGILVYTGILGVGIRHQDAETLSDFPPLISSSVKFIIYLILGAQYRRELRRIMPCCGESDKDKTDDDGVKASANDTSNNV